MNSFQACDFSNAKVKKTSFQYVVTMEQCHDEQLRSRCPITT